MSKNIVDSVIELNDPRLGLLATRRQVDYNGGYVNNWTTKEFYEYVRSKSNIILERDHSGAGQGAIYDDGTKTHIEDAKYFDIIHIDPWKEAKNDFTLGKKMTISDMLFINAIDPYVRFEIGTEEAITPIQPNILHFLLSTSAENLPYNIFDKVEYVVIQSGVGLDLVNRRNTGTFDKYKFGEFIKVCDKNKIKSKEHNGDYLSEDDYKIRFQNGLSSINVGPELAQYETELYLNAMSESQKNDFYEMCLMSVKWRKWVPYDFDLRDKTSLMLTCGHYLYSQFEMPNIDELIKEKMKEKITKLLSYVS